MSDKEKTPEEKLKDMENSRNSWRTWGIISIIGAVFCFIVAVLLLIFIFKYRKQLSVCKNSISDSFDSMKESFKTGIHSAAQKIADKTLGGCGACVAGGCGCDISGGCDCKMSGGCGCSTTGGCDYGMTGGAANSSSFLNKLLKKK